MYFNANGSLEKTNTLISEFVEGWPYNHKLTENEQKYLDEVKRIIDKEEGGKKTWSFLNGSRQTCDNLFISIWFRGNRLTWKDLPQYFEEWNIGPYYYPTDFGACCFLTPHLHLKPIDKNKTIAELYKNLNADAKNGDYNGLEIILDAERFNYAVVPSGMKTSAGFKISLHHHQDKPMMQFSSQLIHTGTMSEINLKPTITNTTDAAIDTFNPKERNCYTEDDVSLNYLTYGHGYRYEINNCLIDQVIREIIWKCRCLPYIAIQALHSEYSEYIPLCTGTKLSCANEKLRSISMSSPPSMQMLEKPTPIGNKTKPPPIECLQGCSMQGNTKEISFASYPEQKTFFNEKAFCDTASHIRQVTCKKNENRRILMHKDQPNLCPILEEFEEYFGNTSTCDKWPANYFEKYDEENEMLKNEVYNYAKENLALVNVAIQSPYSTLIKRDIAMTRTSYVANAGGLLGLCLGCSFISLIEIIFWCCCCCKEFKKNVKSCTYR